MWTYEMAVERLEAMEAHPRMWADTKKSFVAKVHLILEFMGVFDVSPSGRAGPRDGVEVPQTGSVNDAWAKTFMRNFVWPHVPKVRPNE